MRLIERFPTESKFKSALLMDPVRAEALAQLPEPEEQETPPLTPEGYTREVYLMLYQIDLLKQLTSVMVSAFGGKPPAFKPEPRPVTAEQAIRQRVQAERDKAQMRDVLSTLGVDF